MPGDPPAPGTGGPSPYLDLKSVAGTLVFAGIFLAILMGAMDGLVVATVLPRIALDLHQASGVTFVVSAYLIASTIAVPIFARVSDITSRRNVMLVGLAVFIAGSALAGLSQNLTELIVLRGVQGFGGGGVFPVAIALVAQLYPPLERPRIVGLLTGAAGVAIVAGPLLGNYIVSVTTWRWVFYINLPFGVFAAVMLLIAVGPLLPSGTGGFDVAGTALLSGWVTALMVALVQVADSGWAWTNPIVVALLATAVVLFAGFVALELRLSEPLVPLRLLGRRVIAAASGVSLFTGIVFSALITFLSVFVGLVLGYGTADVRDIVYFVALPLIVGAALSGQLLTRVSYRALVAPGLLASGLAGIALAFVTSTTPLWSLSFGFLLTGGLALPLIPVGFGLGLGFAGATVAVQNEAPPSEVGAAIGLTRFFQSLGGAVGISLLTILQLSAYQRLSSGASTPGQALDALARSYGEVFLILAACVLVAFGFALLFVGRIVPRPASSTAEPPAPIPTAR